MDSNHFFKNLELSKIPLEFKDGKESKLAQTFYKKLLRIDPNCLSNVGLGIGHCFNKMSEPNKAKKVFKRTLRLNPRCVGALVGLAIIELNHKTRQSIKHGIQLLLKAYTLQEEEQLMKKTLKCVGFVSDGSSDRQNGECNKRRLKEGEGGGDSKHKKRRKDCRSGSDSENGDKDLKRKRERVRLEVKDKERVKGNQNKVTINQREEKSSKQNPKFKEYIDSSGSSSNGDIPREPKFFINDDDSDNEVAYNSPKLSPIIRRLFDD